MRKVEGNFMQVDFGYIVEYDASTGIGWLSRTLLSVDQDDQQVQFRNQNIGDVDLANRLQKNSLRGVRVYYAFEIQDNRNEAIDLWLAGSRNPFPYSDQFIPILDRIWHDLGKDKPAWLDSVTKAAAGSDLHQLLSDERKSLLDQMTEARRQETELQLKQQEMLRNQKIAAMEQAHLAEDEVKRQAASVAEENREKELLALRIMSKERAHQIHDFCKSHKITSLIHFTRVENLVSILASGLIARETLERYPIQDRPSFNDHRRIDNCNNATCLSISFPNYKMFYRMQLYKGTTWAVMVLDAAILWELDCAFCQENASSNNVRYLPIDERKTSVALTKLFSDHPSNSRQKLNIPIYYHTHPQAEVLVFEPIPPRYIKAIHFPVFNLLQEWRTQNPKVDHPGIACDEQYFRPRCDYSAWFTQHVDLSSDDGFSQEPDFFTEEIPF